jgi:hypothetical protein
MCPRTRGRSGGLVNYCRRAKDESSLLVAVGSLFPVGFGLEKQILLRFSVDIHMRSPQYNIHAHSVASDRIEI